MTWQNKIENMSNLSAFSINFCTFCLKKQHAKQGIQLCCTIFPSSMSHPWKKYTQHYIHPNHVLYRVSPQTFTAQKGFLKAHQKTNCTLGKPKVLPPQFNVLRSIFLNAQSALFNTNRYILAVYIPFLAVCTGLIHHKRIC